MRQIQIEVESSNSFHTRITPLKESGYGTAKWTEGWYNVRGVYCLWKSIDRILYSHEIPPKTINIITTSRRFRTHSATRMINPAYKRFVSRAKQGFTLSPFLFIMTADWLTTTVIKQTCNAMDFYFTLEDFYCEDFRFLACKNNNTKRKITLVFIRATLKHGIRKPEYGTGNQNPESGIRNPDIMNDDRNKFTSAMSNK